MRLRESDENLETHEHILENQVDAMILRLCLGNKFDAMILKHFEKYTELLLIIICLFIYLLLEQM